MNIVISCEHAGNHTPEAYQALFAGQEERIASHRGWDPGARELAEQLAEAIGCPLFLNPISRLLIDCNRSQSNPRLFSAVIRAAPRSVSRSLLREVYIPFRNEVETAIRRSLRKAAPVLHLSVHTFTPELDGEIRTADIGLLYDPSRIPEKELCMRWKEKFRSLAPSLRVRFNYPYRGTADGFTTALRNQFSAADYRGIELEVNHRDWQHAETWRHRVEVVTAAFSSLCRD